MNNLPVLSKYPETNPGLIACCTLCLSEKSKNGYKLDEIKSEDLKKMNLEDNVANILNKLKEEFEKSANSKTDNTARLKKKHAIQPKQEQNILNKIQDSPNIADKLEKGVRKLGDRNRKGAFHLQAKDDHYEHQIHKNNEDNLFEKHFNVRNGGGNGQRKFRPNIRARRIRRELTNIYINPKKTNWNRSWYLDPRNPWNKNLRFIKHVKLFDTFYLDFYTREGSDRLPSNETFCKIQPPPGFYATKYPYSARFDSQPVSTYVNEMEKMAKVLDKYDPNDGFVYARPSNDFRREARNKNYSAILAQEELLWKKQLSQIKYKLKLKNITKTEHDKAVEYLEKDKKLKYKLYRTRTTKHIIKQAMEMLSLANEFAKSCIVRDKRDIGYIESEDVKDKFMNVHDKKKRAKKLSIRNKRHKRDIFEDERKLDAKLDNLRRIQRKKLSAGQNINGKRVVRKKRAGLDNWEHGSYIPPSNSVKDPPVVWPNRKPLDYGPIARHNALYYDDSVDFSHPCRTKAPNSPNTPSTYPESRKTTNPSPKEIQRRTELLQAFKEDEENALRFAKQHEEEFLALKNSLNITMRKRRDISLTTPSNKEIEHNVGVDNAKDPKKDMNILLETMNKIAGMKPTSIENKNCENSKPFQLIFQNDFNPQDILAKELQRQKRSLLDDLLKGPPPDKFEKKKTKLEMDVQEAAKKPGVLKEIEIEGTENINKKIFKMYEENINQVDVNKVANVNYDFGDSRRDPDHPDNNRVDVYAWREWYDRKIADMYMQSMDYSLGIRDRMYKDYLKLRNETEVGMIDRRLLNRIELERAQKERAEFLRKQPIPKTTTEQPQSTCDPRDLSSFQTKEKKGRKRMPAKERLKERVEELKDLRKGIL